MRAARTNFYSSRRVARGERFLDGGRSGAVFCLTLMPNPSIRLRSRALNISSNEGKNPDSIGELTYARAYNV
jgi:hypothetical protein